jgi:hypothetical protein
MGHISYFDLNALKDKYNASVFIETGTYLGDSLAHAATFNFKKLISIEIDSNLVAKARNRFKDDNRIEIVEGSSSEVLEGILDSVQENIILWLDAHFPGYMVSGGDINGEKDRDKRVPLEKEIAVLSKRIGRFNDVLLIDDLRCYEDYIPNVKSFNDHIRDCGHLENHSAITREEVIGTDSKFIYTAFSNSHNISKIFAHEGYLSVLPKQ